MTAEKDALRYMEEDSMAPVDSKAVARADSTAVARADSTAVVASTAVEAGTGKNKFVMHTCSAEMNSRMVSVALSEISLAERFFFAAGSTSSLQYGYTAVAYCPPASVHGVQPGNQLRWFTI
jgi:hypothetical protein